MNILYIARFYSALGGAERCSRETAERLRKKHNVYLAKALFNNLLLDTPLLFLKALWTALTRRVDIIIASDTVPSGFIGTLVKKTLCRKAKLAVYVHYTLAEIDYINNKPGPIVAFSRFTLRNTDTVICISRWVSGFLKKKQECAGKTFIIYPGSNKEKPRNKKSLRKKIGIPTKAKVLITVSRLVEHKKIDRIIKAVSKLPENVYAIIVGTGDKKQQLEQIAKETNTDKRILFTGAVSEKDLSEYYSASDAYVSASDKEGFGLTITEADAHGLMCIGPSNHGSKEALKLVKGLPLKDPKDADELVRKIRKALRTKKTKPAFTRSWTQHCEELLKTINRKTRPNKKK